MACRLPIPSQSSPHGEKFRRGGVPLQFQKYKNNIRSTCQISFWIAPPWFQLRGDFLFISNLFIYFFAVSSRMATFLYI
jgi:hypothetical protein